MYLRYKKTRQRTYTLYDSLTNFDSAISLLMSTRAHRSTKKDYNFEMRLKFKNAWHEIILELFC